MFSQKAWKKRPSRATVDERTDDTGDAHSAATSLVVVDDPKSSDSSLIDFVATKSCGSDPSDSGQSPFKMCGENSGDSAPLSDDSLSKVHKPHYYPLLARINTNSFRNASTDESDSFIQMWRTLYEMINIGDIDQLLNSLALVGTTLFQLNEKCPFSQTKLDAKTAEASSEEAITEGSVENVKALAESVNEDNYSVENDLDAAQLRRITQNHTGFGENEWQVNFEQILAAVLDDAPLANFLRRNIHCKI
ncbi:TBC1 domain member 9 [Parelaphostrongylus tenuis]|uniref:TBC1 domain member 9 n=1 Tax=Parelaphostrongylus tenuis TaxID=148309 RepID=A0AAD5QVE2_PARTN|nr:TBC1 domain member 9 [Parelaphostrongylus tenuis]